MTATIPPRVLPDTARTRRTDPLSSHHAADKSSASIRGVKDKVLILLAEHGPSTGNLINELFELAWSRRGWHPVAFESPRKRVEELAKDGEVIILNDTDPRGTPRVYALPGQEPVTGPDRYEDER